jgi:hypothetical protein
VYTSFKALISRWDSIREDRWHFKNLVIAVTRIARESNSIASATLMPRSARILTTVFSGNKKHNL